MAEKILQNPSPDYTGNLKQAFEIARRNRFLWFLGILAGGGASSFNPSGGGNGFLEGDSSSKSLDAEKVWTEVLNWANEHILLIAIVATLVVILVIIMVILSCMARAGLVQSVHMITKGEKSSFLGAMRFGWHKWWRVFGASLFLGSIFLLVLVIFGALTVGAFYLGTVLGILTVLLIDLPILIFMSIFVGLIFEYSVRFIALKDEKAIQSLKSGYSLLKSRKKETLFVWLMTIVIGMISGMALVIGIVFAALILGLVGVILYLLSHIVGIAYAVFAITVFVVVVVIAAGFISSFISAYWTLSFKQLEKIS